MTPPESMTTRHYHSITATSLGPGLTEVLVFGGEQTLGGSPIIETTLLRFGNEFVFVLFLQHKLHPLILFPYRVDWTLSV